MGTSPFCPSCYPDCGKRTGTDSRGGFRIRSLDHALIFHVLVVAKGFKPTFVENVDPGRGAIQVALPPRETNAPDEPRLLKGKVVDAEGRPVVGAMVEPFGIAFAKPKPVPGQPGATMSGTYGPVAGVEPLAITDEAGEFWFLMPEGERDATLLVDVKARDLAPAKAQCVGGATRTNTIALAKGVTVNGTVRDEGGRALSGVRVWFISDKRDIASPESTGPLEIGTDAEGRFSLPNVPAGRAYRVGVGMAGRLSKAGLATPMRIDSVGKDGTTTNGVDFVARPGAGITGRVVLLDGKPVPAGTRLLLTREDGWDTQEFSLPQDGQFTFRGVPQGERLGLFLRLPGYHVSPDTPTPGFDRNRGGIILTIPPDTGSQSVRFTMAPD